VLLTIDGIKSGKVMESILLHKVPYTIDLVTTLAKDGTYSSNKVLTPLTATNSTRWITYSSNEVLSYTIDDALSINQQNSNIAFGFIKPSYINH
jgi:hypothetical protein